MSVQEGVKYSITHAINANYQSHLRTHKMAVHMGIKYSCNQCDMKFMEQGSLKTHEMLVHEGIRYSCNQCDFKANYKSYLKTQKVSYYMRESGTHAINVTLFLV